jgi:hypothetical protein
MAIFAKLMLKNDEFCKNIQLAGARLFIIFFKLIVFSRLMVLIFLTGEMKTYYLGKLIS